MRVVTPAGTTFVRAEHELDFAMCSV